MLRLSAETQSEGRMSEPLKPCPFCGKKGVWFRVNRRDPYPFKCGCINSRCNVRALAFAFAETEKKAIAAWNRRAEC